MSRQLVVIIALLATLIVVASSPSNAGEQDSSWRVKVDPWVLDTAANSMTEFLVFLSEQADLTEAERLTDKKAKGALVYRALTEVAERTQGAILETLDDQRIEHRSYWVANMIWVRGDLGTVRAMAERDDVAHVYANPAVHLELPPHTPSMGGDSPDAVEWNIAHVNADDVWALGITGDGVVAAGQDTGYMWNHPALVNQYRGGPAGNHAYNWHDAIHTGGGSCGPDSPFPCDDHGHGTHTMGTVVGDDGLGNQVGMAPGAKWIGCRNMDQGTGTPATYAECYQFFIAPTDLSGQNPNPAMAPDVINNSWGCPPDEGCTDPNVLLSVVQAVRAAGIVTVHSAGNDGSSCGTVADPAAIYDESFSVGATDSGDAIANFSSRGPVTVDGSNRLKPDITAPGVDIRSSTRDGSYQGGWDGTSMAGPHVAGLVALLISGNPGLAGDVDAIETVIEQSAVPLTSSQGCGGSGPTDVPNNVYGWGRIDALAAIISAVDFRVDVVPDVVPACIPDTVGDTLVSVSRFHGFAESITLTGEGLPTGVSVAFDPNPVPSSGDSTMTVSVSGSATPGSTLFDVVGTASPSGTEQRAPVTLVADDQGPGSITLVAPSNGAVDVGVAPTLSWTAADHALTYIVEIATDPGFTSVVYSAQVVLVLEHTVGSTLAPETLHYWRVTASNGCGSGPPSSVFSFTTRAIPPVLLVDDDDNNPDVRATYTAALATLGMAYDLWDTNNSDTEPAVVDLAPYPVVIWFTGDEFGGAAGPGSTGEAALADWLDSGGRCLLLSGQDYYYDRSLTPFMESHLGLASATSDTGQTSVTGTGGPFVGLGPYTLSYPFSNYSDTMTAAGYGHLAFTGDEGGAAVGAWTGSSYATLWGFPWEALPTAADREAALAAFFDICVDAADLLFADDFESGAPNGWSLIVQ